MVTCVCPVRVRVALQDGVIQAVTLCLMNVLIGTAMVYKLVQRTVVITSVGDCDRHDDGNEKTTNIIMTTTRVTIPVLLAAMVATRETKLLMLMMLAKVWR